MTGAFPNINPDTFCREDYDVLERLGEGAFGKVYKARHKKTEDSTDHMNQMSISSLACFQSAQRLRNRSWSL